MLFKTLWSAFHSVQRYTRLFILLIPDADTNDIDSQPWLNGQMFNSGQQLGHHAEHQEGSAHVHHSDVGDPSGSIAKTAHSTEREGRFSEDAKLVDILAAGKAREAPPPLRRSAHSFRRRWIRMLAVSCRSFATSLVSVASHQRSGTDASVPDLAPCREARS